MPDMIFFPSFDEYCLKVLDPLFYHSLHYPNAFLYRQIYKFNEIHLFIELKFQRISPPLKTSKTFSHLLYNTFIVIDHVFSPSSKSLVNKKRKKTGEGEKREGHRLFSSRSCSFSKRVERAWMGGWLQTLKR